MRDLSDSDDEVICTPAVKKPRICVPETSDTLVVSSPRYNNVGVGHYFSQPEELFVENDNFQLSESETIVIDDADEPSTTVANMSVAPTAVPLVAPAKDNGKPKGFEPKDKYRCRTFVITFWVDAVNYNIVDGVCVPNPVFVSGEGTRVPSVVVRAMKGMYGYKAEGQYEACPTTQKLHWQGYFTLFSSASGGVDKKCTLSSCRAKFLEAVRRDDASYGTVCDGLVLRDKYVKENWFIDHKSEHSTMEQLIRYCTVQYNEDGSLKRLFGSSVSWCSLSTSVPLSLLDQKPNCEQVGKMLVEGMKPLEIINAAPGVGLQYYRNICDVSRGMTEKQNRELAKKPRCGNAWCRLHYFNDEITRRVADRIGKSFNEVLELMKLPCLMKCVYLFGAPRTGKSTTTNQYAQYLSPNSVYIKASDSSFWGAGETAYNGEQSVVIHDCTESHFNGLADFKRIVDCQAHKLNVKNSETMLVAKNFLIDSQMCPLSLLLKLCKNVLCSQDDYYAFTKRFTNVYEYTSSKDLLRSVRAINFPPYVEYQRTVKALRTGQTLHIQYQDAPGSTGMDQHRTMMNAIESARAEDFVASYLSDCTNVVPVLPVARQESELDLR